MFLCSCVLFCENFRRNIAQKAGASNLVYTDSCGLMRKCAILYPYSAQGEQTMAEAATLCLRPDAGVAVRHSSRPSRRRPLPAPCTATSASPKCCTSIRARGSTSRADTATPSALAISLLYNQGDLHEVTSSLHHEIGTFCFGISGLHLRGLPEGTFHPGGNRFRPPGGRRDRPYPVAVRD